MNIIETEHLFKDYSQNERTVHAVRDISFSIEENTVYGLAGESGSGKSTLALLLSNLLEQTSGSIFFCGKNIHGFSKSEEKEFRKNVQIVFQNPSDSLNPKMTVRHILEEPLRIHKIAQDKKERNALVNEMRTLCGLDSSVLEKYPHELSGGQRQRVSIASSMILKPKFIIFDEAVSSLDVLIQTQIINILKLMQKSFKQTYLFISHNLNVISYIADVTGVMYSGTIVEQAKTDELVKNPRHPYTQALFSAAFNTKNQTECQTEDSLKKRAESEFQNSGFRTAGCPYFQKCRKRTELCAAKKPEFKEIEKNHFCACHFS